MLECCKLLTIEDIKPSLCSIIANGDSCLADKDDDELRRYEFVIETEIKIPHIRSYFTKGGRIIYLDSKTIRTKIALPGEAALAYRECCRSRGKPTNVPDPDLFKDSEDIGKPGTCAVTPEDDLPPGPCRRWARAVNTFNHRVLNSLNVARQRYCEEYRFQALLYELLSEVLGPGNQFPEPQVTLKSYCKLAGQQQAITPFPDHVFKAVQ